MSIEVLQIPSQVPFVLDAAYVGSSKGGGSLGFGTELTTLNSS